MHTAIHHIHIQPRRRGRRAYPFRDGLPERHILKKCRESLCRDRNGEDGVRAEARFIRRTVQLNEVCV